MNEREIFMEALLRQSPAERDAYLNEACGGDVALRRRVEQLLALQDRSSPILDRRPAELLEQLDEISTQVGSADSAPGGAAVDPLSGYLAPGSRPDSLGRLGH